MYKMPFDRENGTVIFPSFKDSIDRIKLGGGGGGGNGGGGPSKSDFNFRSGEEMKTGSVFRMFLTFLFQHYGYIRVLPFNRLMELVSLIYVRYLLPVLATHINSGYDFKIDPWGLRSSNGFEQVILQNYLILTAPQLHGIVGRHVRDWFDIFSSASKNLSGKKYFQTLFLARTKCPNLRST
jgi:hypothetical protein